MPKILVFPHRRRKRRACSCDMIVILPMLFSLISIILFQSAMAFHHPLPIQCPFKARQRPRYNFKKHYSNCNSQEEEEEEGFNVSSPRRSVVIRGSGSLLFFLSQLVNTQNPALAAATSNGTSSNAPITTTKLPTITTKLSMDVRVSRPDGTFYVRDDETDALVQKFQLQIGLFGKAAPTHVERFLSYIIPSEADIREDRPFPSYASSLFKSYDDATGVLQGGTIPSLGVTEFGGSTALQYAGRILPAPLWLETRTTETSETAPLAHSAKGLLIHRKLDVTPTFGITTRSDSSTYVSDFDREYVAFGIVLEGMDFLRYVQELPTYQIERPMQDDNVVQDAAKTVFDAQREFFRGAAKSFGDTRVGKVFPGKLLRRVEVTRIDMITKP